MTVLHPGMGWAQYTDGDYSSGSPQSIAAARSKLELNAAAGTIIETDLPRGFSTLWDSVNDKITPNADGDAYDVRLTVQFNRTSGSDDHVDLELDIGGSIGIIWEQSVSNLKANQRHSVSIPLFVGSTFLANGGTFYANTGSSTFAFWGFNLLMLCQYQRGRNF